MLKAIVFDFDGVLVDSEPLHYRAFLEVAKTLGVTFDYQQYLANLVGYDDRDGLRVILAEAGKTATPHGLAELVESKRIAFENLVMQGLGAIPGALDLVDAAAAEMPVAIASGATRADIDLMLRSLERTNTFQTIVAADDVAQSKPDPQSYALAAQRLAEMNSGLNLQPADCLAIEDTAAGIASARGAGLKTLAITTTTDAAALQQAHRVIEGLKGVNLDDLRQWFN